MKKPILVLTLSLVFGVTFAGVTFAHAADSAAPQTARQALLEMFFSKTPGTFAKHLPAATIAAFDKSGALASLQAYGLLATQFQAKSANGQSFETFETGSVLISGINSQSGEKFEVTVENDALLADEDDITLSFHSYKEKQLERTPYMPTLTFAMKMESGVWKLNEISLTIHVPLADPDFLKKITEGMKAQASHPNMTITGTAGSQPSSSPSQAGFGSDTSVVSAMRTILAAEATYRNTYRAVGYTCTLSDLDGFGGGEANEHQAMLIPSDLAGGRRYGYTFTLSGCAGAPSTSFHLTASPVGNNFGRRAYCTDQSTAIRYSTDGNPATCMASGLPVP